MLVSDLRIRSGKQAGKMIRLPQGKFLIGRGEDCHLRPNNDLVSRHHCVFTFDGIALRLKDLGSTNGTFVNSEQISGTRILKNGDRVLIGKLEFEVILKEQVVDTVVAPVDENPGVIESLSDSGVPHNMGAETVTMSELPSFDQPLEEMSGNTKMLHHDETMVDAPLSSPMQPTAGGYPQQPGYDPNIYGAPGGFGMPQQQNPYMMPQQPYAGQNPMMGMPGYPQQPGMYPGVYPGYNPYQQQPGYQQGYAWPGAGYPQQQNLGYGQMPQMNYAPVQQEAPVEEVEEEEAKPAAAKSQVQVTLPDPKDTGFKEPPPKPPEPKNADGTVVEKPSTKAADILKQMTSRRPGT
jgi:pSer/pThr/pTyr-binding forkhead associated (FHA) protein